MWLRSPVRTRECVDLPVPHAWPRSFSTWLRLAAPRLSSTPVPPGASRAGRGWWSSSAGSHLPEKVFASPSPLEGVSQDTGLPATVALFEPFGCASRLHSASKVPRRNRSAIFLRIPSWGDTLPQFFLRPPLCLLDVRPYCVSVWGSEFILLRVR